jgi:hypothetical protein
MPFARHSGYSFSAASVRQNAPAWGGIYGLSNANGWVFVDTAENIQAALLDHLVKFHAASDSYRATGFTFEVCDVGQRDSRCDRLIAELHPVLNEP